MKYLTAFGRGFVDGLAWLGALYVWVILPILAVMWLASCASAPAPVTPAKAYPTWRCALMNHQGTATVTVVELPKLFPVLALTGCDGGVRQASTVDVRECSGVEVRRRLFRFVSLDMDSMTATYRALEP